MLAVCEDSDHKRAPFEFHSGIFVAVLFTHGLVCSLGTKVIARLQRVWILLNVWYGIYSPQFLQYWL